MKKKQDTTPRFSLDHLSSTEFEEFCHDLLNAIGFTNVNWRKGTGSQTSPSDRGRDIECQWERKDVDGTISLERWYVECKHWKKGIPPTELQSALTWAASENADILLFIASNFLSNAAKDWLKMYQTGNKPRFKIKYWEKPDLERLTAGKSQLVRKFNIGGDFPFLRVLHPAHVLYMKKPVLNSLGYLFATLDGLDPDERDGILSWISFMLIERPIVGYHSKVVFGETVTLPEYDHDFPVYEAFKNRCHELVKSTLLDEPLLVFLIVNWVLQWQMGISDVTSVDEFVQRTREYLEELDGGFLQFVNSDSDRQAIDHLKRLFGEQIETAHEATQRHYEEYVAFCEKVVTPLLQEKYLSYG